MSDKIRYEMKQDYCSVWEDTNHNEIGWVKRQDWTDEMIAL